MIFGAPAGREQLRPREIVAGRDDLVRRFRVGKVARLVDENDPAVHGAGAPARERAGSREAIMRPVGSLAERKATPVATAAMRIARSSGRAPCVGATARRKSPRRRRKFRRALAQAAVASAAGASRFSNRSASAPSA